MKKVLIYMISPKHKECGKAYLESSFVIKKTSDKSSIDIGKICYCDLKEAILFYMENILKMKNLKLLKKLKDLWKNISLILLEN